MCVKTTFSDKAGDAEVVDEDIVLVLATSEQLGHHVQVRSHLGIIPGKDRKSVV